MSWLEKRKVYRLRDRVDSSKRKQVVMPNLGIWKPIAQEAQVLYDKAIDLGFRPSPPIDINDVRNFLTARSEGREITAAARRLPIEEWIDFYVSKHGPSIKGGVNLHHTSSYYCWKKRMDWLKRAWPGKFCDEITQFEVRDILVAKKTIGTQMKWLGILSHLFRSLIEWNEDGNILPYRAVVPPYNPAKKWRKEMKLSQKTEQPDTRVLTLEEWASFRKYLKPRALAICEIALKRFVSLADIRKLHFLRVINGQIRGLREKSGEPFVIPTLAGQPTQYDFRNFRGEFRSAQKKANLFFPASDPRHFSAKDLRRTGATWAYRATKDIVAISRMLGHSNIAMTKRYLNITDEDISTIARTVDRISDDAVQALRSPIEAQPES